MTSRKSASEKDSEPKSPAEGIIEESSSNSSFSIASEVDSESKENKVSEKKRKRSGENTEAGKKSRISSKLSSFALKRNELEDDSELGDV